MASPAHAQRERRVSPDRREDRRRPRPGRRIEDLATHPEGHVDVPSVASYLGVDYRTVDKWIDAGILPAYRFGALWRVKVADLET